MKNTLKSTCRMCHGGCGALLRVEGGRLISVEGDPEAPFNRGSLCSKGRATLELVYHPDRLLFPLKRKGTRGAGDWERVSWDQAISEICESLSRTMERWGPESVAIAQGTGRHHYLEVLRFANAIGTPNVIEPGAAQCFLPRVTVSQLTYGDFPVGDYLGDVPPECAIFWGANPLVSGPDGKVSFSIARALPRIKHKIAVDPIRSETAKKCDLHLQLRPGTDAALALAMIHTIIEESLFDSDFIANWTSGFDEVRAAVRNCTPEWAARITRVSAELVREAARLYALNRPNILEWGVAVDQTPNSLQTVRSLSILRGIAGSIDEPGGELLGMHILKNQPVNLGPGSEKLVAKRLGADTYKLLGGHHAFIRMAHAPTLFKAMLEGQPYPIGALLIFGSNLLTSYANARYVMKAIEGLPLVVAVDFFRTPTSELADYILPAAAWPEIDSLVGLPYMAENAVAVQRRAISVGECKSDEEIMYLLASQLGVKYQRADLPEELDKRLRRTGLTFEELGQLGQHCPAHIYRKYEKKGFRTPSRKIELASSVLRQLGYQAVPSYREPPEGPISTPDLLAEYPYILVTGARTSVYFHSEGRQIASRRAARKHPLALFHPETAKKHEVRDGDWVLVSSPRGSASFKAKLTDDILPDLVSVDHAWWFPEKGPPDYGVWESNANLLTNGSGPYDPAFGSSHLRALLCKVTKRQCP